MYKNQTDETLVLLTLSGEQKAYEVLVMRHQSSVIAVANSVVKNQFMAEDSAQDAFVTAWMKLNTLCEPSKFGSWVRKIAKNCALNTVRRYRGIVPLDQLENCKVINAQITGPEEKYVDMEEKYEVKQSLDNLPEKVKRIIQLYYFEGLSIYEIAQKMSISEGTVKWQLNDGRKRMRKELCAMNEKWNDTLVEKVMKKVEELKLWRLKNSKDGFEIVYKDVLKEVENLPESKNKYHALADVLHSGWWWLPGTKNDELFESIKEAAIKGKNEEAMEFILAREKSEIYGNVREKLILEKNIPMLEKYGFKKALAAEYYALGCVYYYDMNNTEKGDEALMKAKSIFAPTDEKYYLSSCIKPLREKKESIFKNKDEKNFGLGATIEKYKYIDKELRFWNNDTTGEGYINTFDTQANDIYRNASFCDGYFFKDLKLGEEYVGSDKTTLKFESENEKVDTPAGIFEGCFVYVTKRFTEYGLRIYKNYYKPGVGIVKCVSSSDGLTEERVLSAYNINGGEGLLPFAKGNRWEYTTNYNPEFIDVKIEYSVEYADEKTVILKAESTAVRHGYNKSSFVDMIQAIRNEYYYEQNGREYLKDVTEYVECVNELAKTEIEKEWARLSSQCAKRIWEGKTGVDFTGHWNFFAREIVTKANNSYKLGGNHRWSFEWKSTDGPIAEMGMLCNDIYGILDTATGCVWNEEWQKGASPTVEYMLWGSHPVKTNVKCEDGGRIETRAGAFENCLKITLDISGLGGGLAYREGHKEYYFADKIGIVRVVNEYCNGAIKPTYDLVSYYGEGEGYMPFENGLKRVYEAVNLTDGYVGGIEYSYHESENGEIVIFSDKTGIRKNQSPITSYSSVLNELKESNGCNSIEEAHEMYALNTFKLMEHTICRPAHHRNNAPRSIGICKFNMEMMESFGNGTVPDAWFCAYAWTALVRSAAHFGNGEIEKGFEYLDISFEYYEKWKNFKKGEELDSGDTAIFGGIKLIKGKECIVMPSNEKAPLEYGYRMDGGSNAPYYALSADYGWEWFNYLRNHESYYSYLDKSKQLLK
ncbi:MAG: sigma-70 family RNA polymerase sigma factor [Clostridia bacterium]|nr:sigma-70 family RNA polymerase sigma factor [Clostridia bacterium]